MKFSGFKIGPTREKVSKNSAPDVQWFSEHPGEPDGDLQLLSLFTGAALYALSSVLLISNKFWDWTGPDRGRAGLALNGPWNRLCPVQ